MESTVLCIVHSEHNNLGRLPSVFRHLDLNHQRSNFLDGAFPAGSPNDYQGIIVFGGTDSVSEGLGHEYIPEYKYLERAVRASVPIIGICLGGQILSEIYGAEAGVQRFPAPEIGFTRIHPTIDAPANFWTHNSFFQWHWDNMPCPASGTVLGRTEEFGCQAYELGNTIALQFHPDATPCTVEAWAALGHRTMNEYSQKSIEEHIKDAHLYEAAVQKWVVRLVGQHFMSGDLHEQRR